MGSNKVTMVLLAILATRLYFWFNVRLICYTQKPTPVSVDVFFEHD